MASKSAASIHYAKSRKARRLWYISPEGFRELRHSCLLSRQRAADYLGVSVRTIRHWDAGRNRVPWSAVRLLRLVRAGELGGLDDAWEGWTINRHGLRSPCGRVYTVQNLRHWWLMVEQARFWRASYDRATLPCAAQPREATGRSVTFAAEVFSQVESSPRETEGRPGLQPAASPETAFPVLPACGKAPAEPDAGRAEGAVGGRAPGALPGPPALVTGKPGMVGCDGLAPPSSAGCTLPDDGSLPSSCHQKPEYVTLMACGDACARQSRPNNNMGLASYPPTLPTCSGLADLRGS